MSRCLVLLLAASAAFAADDSWAKVKALKSGTEIRIVKRGSAKPIEAKLDEARDDSLVVVLKNEQVAIQKDQIDRLDYRSKPGGRAVKTEGKVTDPDTRPQAGMDGGPAVPGHSYSTSVTMSKPEYETIYRRAAAKK